MTVKYQKKGISSIDSQMEDVDAVKAPPSEEMIQKQGVKRGVGSASADTGEATASSAEVADFEWSYTEEPHATRRKEILQHHPEVKKLFGIDPNIKWKVFFAVSVQILLASVIHEAPWWALTVVAYTIGGTINHSMTLGMHEISHNLAFRKILYNRILGIIANLPFGIPAFVSFKRYHMEHHKYQGEDGVDTDVPTTMEGHFFVTPLRKLVWCFLQPLFYALRPMTIVPKKPGKMEGINFLCQFLFNAAIVYFFGVKSLVYLIISTLLGMGFHPMAGHFIAEHYTFIKSQETYSYYGPLNWFSFNVGYHNEHHDFPNIPGSRLPELRKIAPEYYDVLPYHSGWMKVILDYIRLPPITPFSRVIRATLSDEERKTIRAQ
eukprot:gb/GECG01010701.1/.p1 GENE.gb/GECG01010701.1/~~gb/GECG01010701.1/.p1  ORF type:complete len:378 (+),score=35.49 gb/GECG01010701.1/:1-1134(+)